MRKDNSGYTAFRAKVTKGSRYTVGAEIKFADGTVGQIRKIQSVETNSDGHVFVIGYYVEVGKRG